MSDKEFQKYLDRKFEEIPQEFLQKCLAVLPEFIDEATQDAIRAYHREEGCRWIGNNHHTWGMALRNFLRENGLTDDNLPDGNWDDYYIQVVERFVGVR